MEWPEPKVRDCDPLAHFERLLWDKYNTAYLDHAAGVHPGWNRQWMEWLRAFRDKLSTSQDIKKVCRNPCRSSYHAHTLLVFLFYYADLFARSKSPTRVLSDLRPFRDNGQDLDQRQRQARADLRQFDKMKAAIEGLSDLYAKDDRDGMQVLIGEWQRRADRWFMATATWDDVTGALSPDRPRLPKPRGSSLGKQQRGLKTDPQKVKRGRPKFDGSQKNIYLALVRSLVSKAYRGPDRDMLTLGLVKHFSPTLLDAEYDSNRFFSQQQAFKEHPGVGACLRNVERHFEKGSIMEIFPYPSFAQTPPSSSIVTDRAR